MRRTTGASASRLCGRVCAVPLTVGMLLGTVLSGGGGLAAADPASPESVAALVAAVANANQKLQDLGAAVQQQQESVNKALVDVQTARDAAAAAQLEVDATQQGVKDANAAIVAAQQRFDTFAATTYMNGPSGSFLTAADPADIIDTAAAGETLAASAQQVIGGLQRARLEQVNKESSARLAKQKADQAAADALASQDAAVSALKTAQTTFGAQQVELDRLTAERAAAQAKLDAARNWSVPATGQASSAAPAPGGDRWDPAAPGRAARENRRTAVRGHRHWDTTLPMVPSAFVSGDPIAIVNAVLRISATSAQITADLGRKS